MSSCRRARISSSRMVFAVIPNGEVHQGASSSIGHCSSPNLSSCANLAACRAARRRCFSCTWDEVIEALEAEGVAKHRCYLRLGAKGKFHGAVTAATHGLSQGGSGTEHLVFRWGNRVVRHLPEPYSRCSIRGWRVGTAACWLHRKEGKISQQGRHEDETDGEHTDRSTYA